MIDWLNIAPSMENWNDNIDDAPRDGTPIIGLYDDDECEIYWSERPVCMLGSVNGGFPPGWATHGDETDFNLPMDEPQAWLPVN